MSEKLEVESGATADGTKSKLSFWSSRRVFGAVEKDHGDLPLLACCLVTGMVDAATFSNYAVFVGVGNVVRVVIYADK